MEMREGADGVFRSPDDDIPLPYGLHEDSQEPYVAIIAPNIDKITSDAFDARTLAGQRTRRGLIAFAASVVVGLLVIGVVVTVQWVTAAL